MTYLFFVGFLILSVVIANFALVFVLNFAGLPGALIAGRTRSDFNWRWFSGFLVALLGQSYFALAYVAFIVNWSRLAIVHQGLSAFVVWPAAFIALAVPFFRTYSAAVGEAKEDGYFELRHAQLDALGWTTFIAAASFFIFAFFPRMVPWIYPWVPYVTP